ncbi:MAG: hypothetical protein DMF91_03135, partial [Acidobacteria bacterium]
MQRAIRFTITGLVLICLTKFFEGGLIPLALSAAPAPELRVHGASDGWRAEALRTGVALADRLLRRPRAMFGSPAVPPAFGLRFDGVDDRVTFGKNLATGTPTFTLEAWIMREGAGKTASTGTGGVVAVPLVTKGVAE